MALEKEARINQTGVFEDRHTGTATATKMSRIVAKPSTTPPRDFTEDELDFLVNEDMRLLALRWGYWADTVVDDEGRWREHAFYEKETKEFRGLQYYTDIVFRVLQQLNEDLQFHFHWDIQQMIEQAEDLSIGYSREQLEKIQGLLQRFYHANEATWRELESYKLQGGESKAMTALITAAQSIGLMREGKFGKAWQLLKHLKRKEDDEEE
jgi:hypothetical protein